MVMALAMGVRLYFNPQGSREPRRIGGGARSGRIIFQSTRLSRASTIQPWVKRISRFNFNPQGSREPRHQTLRSKDVTESHFNPQGSREPRQMRNNLFNNINHFNPQGSREPRLSVQIIPCLRYDFNPQGSREPRPSFLTSIKHYIVISIHKALASLDRDALTIKTRPIEISIHKALASLDLIFCSYMQHRERFQSTRLSRASTIDSSFLPAGSRISIHKALASLDTSIYRLN